MHGVKLPILLKNFNKQNLFWCLNKIALWLIPENCFIITFWSDPNISNNCLWECVVVGSKRFNTFKLSQWMVKYLQQSILIGLDRHFNQSYWSLMRDAECDNCDRFILITITSVWSSIHVSNVQLNTCPTHEDMSHVSSITWQNQESTWNPPVTVRNSVQPLPGQKSKFSVDKP